MMFVAGITLLLFCFVCCVSFFECQASLSWTTWRSGARHSGTLTCLSLSRKVQPFLFLFRFILIFSLLLIIYDFKKMETLNIFFLITLILDIKTTWTFFLTSIYHHKYDFVFFIIGYIGSVRLTVPWNNLRSKPIILELDRVFLIAKTRPESNVLSSHWKYLSIVVSFKIKIKIKIK